MKEKKVSFEEMLSFFPEMAPPILLGETTYETFSKENKPLPAKVSYEYFDFLLKEETDEIVPCFQFQDAYDFKGIVIWRAALMSYEYHLLTYTKKGQPIMHRIIGGLIYDGENMIRTVVSIDEDWTFHLLQGVHGSDKEPNKDNDYLVYELTPEGKLISGSNQNPLQTANDWFNKENNTE